MHKLIVLIMLIALPGLACKKEYSGSGKPLETTSRIEIIIDGESVSVDYGPDKVNRFSAYSFGGVAGKYFGFSSYFDISDKSSICINMGTILTTEISLSEKDIMSLISPGEKKFGSLGAFSTYPKLKPGCAELAYTDKDGSRWSSTQIRERNTPYGIDAEVHIPNHENDKFVIEKTTPVTIGDKTGYRIEGYFDCSVYEVNGKNKKRMKGDFSGVIGRDN